MSSQGETQARDSAGESIPITDVVLFSSGVGYFGRSGSVNGDAKVELTFSSEQINDLLKSLMVLDLDGGRVSGVSYASHDPEGKALQAFGLDLACNPTLGNLLAQLRGVAVGITSPEGKYEGKVLSVETRSKKTKSGDLISFDVLNLLTDEGVVPFETENLRDIQVLDANLNEDLQKALAVLARSRDMQKRSVAISLSGEGDRRVRIAYILESPVWKTSYRLVIGDAPLLQGWAIVDNTTESDWNDVKLSLVSGRPISFIQDLYTPLYLSRPVVQPQLFAGLRPVAHGEALGDMLDEECMECDMEMAMPASMAPPAPMKRMAAKSSLAEMKGEDFDEFAGSSMQASATGGEVGEMFAYTVGTPVGVARRSSAMLPVISEVVDVEKLSVYNANNHPTHPYSGFKLKNITSLALMSGPVTVFDEGIYAGDSQMPNLQPGEERIMSYALDLGCSVEALSKDAPRSISSVKVVRGVIYIHFKQQMTTVYTVKNKKDATKAVRIEHPFYADWELLTPEKYEERTDTLYRFRMDLEPKATKELEVKTEHISLTQITLTDTNLESLVSQAVNEDISPAVRKAFEKGMEIKADLDEVRQKRERAEQRKNELYSDQNEARKNLGSVPSSSKLYSRYLKKLEDKQNEIDDLEIKLENLRESEERHRKMLEEYLVSLDVE